MNTYTGPVIKFDRHHNDGAGKYFWRACYYPRAKFTKIDAPEAVVYGGGFFREEAESEARQELARQSWTVKF